MNERYREQVEPGVRGRHEPPVAWRRRHERSHGKPGGRHPEGNGERDFARALGWLSVGIGLAELAAPRALSQSIGMQSQRPLLMRLLGLRELANGIGILARPDSAGLMWGRVAGDLMDMTLLGGALFNDDPRRRSQAVGALAVVSGVAALDFQCARQLSAKSAAPVVRSHAITVNRPPEEVYHFWRNFENLPRFMRHLESVQMKGDGSSHWVARGPAGRKIRWDSQLTEDIPNRLLAWRSLEGANIHNAGHVRFDAAEGGRGTRVLAEIDYWPPAGKIGAGIAALLGEEPGLQMKEDLFRFKQVMETGEVLLSDATLARRARPAVPPASRLGAYDVPSAGAGRGRPAGYSYRKEDIR